MFVLSQPALRIRRRTGKKGRSAEALRRWSGKSAPVLEARTHSQQGSTDPSDEMTIPCAQWEDTCTCIICRGLPLEVDKSHFTRWNSPFVSISALDVKIRDPPVKRRNCTLPDEILHYKIGTRQKFKIGGPSRRQKRFRCVFMVGRG